jgi:hypothetical protein
MSEDRDPRVVHVAPDLRTADVIATWLGEKGFKCEVVAPDPPTVGTEGIGLEEPELPGVEIRVIDVDQAGTARDLIAEQREAVQAVRELQEKRATRTGTVTVACEECGKPSDWPAAEMGSTQECPHCARYMDVPDPDDDWGDIDFGAPDDDTDPKPAA